MGPRLAEQVTNVVNITAVKRTATTAVKGTAQNVSDCEEVTALVNSSLLATSTTCDVKLQHSNTTTDGDFVDITSAAIVQLAPTAANDVVAPISVRPSKKYLRSYMVPGGAQIADGVTVGVNFQLKKLGNLPVVNSPASVVV